MKKCVSLISLALAFAMSTGAFAMEVPTDKPKWQPAGYQDLYCRTG